MEALSEKGVARTISNWALAALVAGLVVPSTAGAFSIEQLPANEVYNDFVVGPGKVELTLRPGESKTMDLKVTNRMGDRRMFQLETEDFTGSTDPEETVVLLGNERGPYTLRDFLIPEQSEFELDNGQRATVRVTVSVPADAEPGGRYGSVLVSTVNRPQGSDSGVVGGAAIVSRIGVLFFVTVPGEVHHDGAMVNFDTTSGKRVFFDTVSGIGLSILYENNGSMHVNPYGAIAITNLSGETVADIDVDPWFAMPDSLRRRDITWNREFLFGRYTATATINRGYGNIIDEASVTFWIIPWKIIVSVLGGLILLIGLARFIGSRFELKRKKRR